MSVSRSVLRTMRTALRAFPAALRAFPAVLCALLILAGGAFIAGGVLVSEARADGPTKDLLDLARPLDGRIAPAGEVAGQVAVAASADAAAPGLVITVQPGQAAYPGVNIKPQGKGWDLSAFGHVEARVVNTGAKAVVFALRVDNEGDWQAAPWNTEQVNLKPGERGTVKVIFGHQYGHKPGYALKPAAVVNILMFSDKADAAKSFRVESLVAGGPAGEKPPVDPASIRIRPKDGVLLGAGVTIDAEKQIEAVGANASVVAGADGRQAIDVALPAAKGEHAVSLKPPAGRWDLTLATEVRVRLKNTGAAPLVPSVQIASNGGPTDLVAAAPVAPGEEREITVSFIPAAPGKGVPVPKAGYFGNEPGTGTKFTSDSAGAVRVVVRHDGEAAVRIESVTAAAPPADVPDWLGKRPPVDGEWVKTFDEEFDGPAVDAAKWNIYGPNYWDRSSHWTKDNLILGGGAATLRFEKKRGFHNDDPDAQPKNLTGRKESDYACGYLDTFGKWRQRYGYFEARVKLPRAPGLWPTFWMMPDRGPADDDGARSDTGNGAMELDIMEHLTRWGPYRYNVALHFDGYGKEHKSVGSSNNYIQADKDGYITAGLLWTPGACVFYGNGRELWRWEGERVSTVPAYFIIEMTTGGWDNNAVDDAQLPADYLIDYVRVWQRKDLASAEDGGPPANGGPPAPKAEAK
jgi:beta-glucanase (GH16 family)